MSVAALFVIRLVAQKHIFSNINIQIAVSYRNDDNFEYPCRLFSMPFCTNIQHLWVVSANIQKEIIKLYSIL